ncbi:MAG: dihydrofolate reductase [Mycobacteriaceae bacterium]
MSRTVGLIWAQAANGVIGRDGALPWHLPEDLAHFRTTTQGATVVMGRKTWESLPAKVRPLPGRDNIIVTTQSGWHAPGAIVAHSLDEALTQGTGEMWVIGGASVYAAALDRADQVVVTELRQDFDGDVHAPGLGQTWRRASAEPPHGWHQSRTGLHYRFVRYSRAPDLDGVGPPRST